VDLDRRKSVSIIVRIRVHNSMVSARSENIEFSVKITKKTPFSFATTNMVFSLVYDPATRPVVPSVRTFLPPFQNV